MIDSSDIKHVSSAHFIGVGGAGMSGIALVLHERGCAVSGSDLKESRYVRQLEEAGVKCFLGHHASDFFPFAADATKLLRRDGAPNLLVVRLTTGREIAEAHPDDSFRFLHSVPTEASRGYPLRGYQKRVFLRKPPEDHIPSVDIWNL